jgi:hypothetical protein
MATPWGGACSHLHWGRDVSFGEDKCQVKKGCRPQNLAAFRNAAIRLLRLAGCNGIATALRDFRYQPRKLFQFLGIVKHRLALQRAWTELQKSVP